MKSIKEMLLKMREELALGIARRSKDTTQGGAIDVGDTLDLVSEERTRELDLILTDRAKQKIEKIDDALERIEDGSYGECEECGVKVPKARLKVMPFAKYCVDCQERVERDEKYAQEEPEDELKKSPIAGDMAEE